MGHPTNTDRAQWAEKAIQAFMDETGTDREDALADLLCNLHHWCDAEGLDFLKEYQRGMVHYAVEYLGDGV